MTTGTGTGTPALSAVARYATVAELKSWVGISDATDDGVIASVLDAASRQIDEDCGRVFCQSAAGTVRYYTATNGGLLLIDDCVSLSAVATDADGDRTYETTWAATDYDLLPENASTDGAPFDQLATAPGGLYVFPAGVRRGVKLTGTWGWPRVPDRVRQACLIRAAWLFKRKDSPLGTTGSAELGIMRVGRWDPDYDRLIETLKRPVVT